MVLQFLGGLVALAAFGMVYAVFNADSEEMMAIKAAAEGKVHDKQKVAEAYWSLYGATYRRRSEWIMLNREEKSAVYKAREDLRDLFNLFPKPTQKHVMSVRPKDLGK